VTHRFLAWPVTTDYPLSATDGLNIDSTERLSETLGLGSDCNATAQGTVALWDSQDGIGTAQVRCLLTEKTVGLG
jgi:hypothetical protein